MERVSAAAMRLGCFHGPDRYGLSGEAAVALVVNCAAQIGVVLLSEDQTKQLKTMRKQQLIQEAVPRQFR